jgi:hypothetical protein
VFEPPPPAATSPPAATEANARAVAKARAAAKANAVAKAKARARARANARQAALRAQARARKNEERSGSGLAPPASTAEPNSRRGLSAAANRDEADVLTSPLIYVVIAAAILLALGSMLVASLPVDALERVLAVEAHYRSELVASFVDRHRLDIALAGVATLLVAAVVALPMVMS